MSSYFETQLKDLLGRQRRAIAELRKTTRHLEVQLDAIAANEDLTAEAREIEVRKARRAAEPKIAALAEEARKARARAPEVVRQMRAARRIELADQIRVRALLAEGWPPLSIAESAVNARHDETLAALRTEIHYWRPDGLKPQPSQIAEIEDAIDEQLAGLTVDGSERQALRAAGDLQREAEAIEPTITFALRTVSGGARPEDRLAAAIATSAARSAEGDA